MCSWGIAPTAPEIEKIKAESADYLNGLNSCGLVDYESYSEAFDFYNDLLDRAYELGKEESFGWHKMNEDPPEKIEEYCVLNKSEDGDYWWENIVWTNIDPIFFGNNCRWHWRFANKNAVAWCKIPIPKFVVKKND